MNKKRLGEVFKELKKNKTDYLGNSTGKSFEDKIARLIQKEGILTVNIKEIETKDKETLKEISKETVKPENFLSNKLSSNFLSQPFGSQMYPDFLILLDDQIYCLEVKFSTKEGNKPFWNTGIPKPNGIYIFGSYGLNDLTFFFGKDVLPENEYKTLKYFFNNELKDHLVQYNKEHFKEQKRGFNVYIRAAFEQSKKYNSEAHTNYFTHPNRDFCEESVINFFS